MQATRILPDLQCSLLCEEIRQEVTGSFFLIGVINFIRVPQLPVVAVKLSVFNRWTAGIGQFTESVRLIAPDQTTVLRKGEVKFALQDANLHATNVTVFGQVEFKTAGAYFVEVLVDDVVMALARFGPVEISALSGMEEKVYFRLPRELVEAGRNPIAPPMSLVHRNAVTRGWFSDLNLKFGSQRHGVGPPALPESRRWQRCRFVNGFGGHID